MITQCYLPPDTSERALPINVACELVKLWQASIICLVMCVRRVLITVYRSIIDFVLDWLVTPCRAAHDVILSPSLFLWNAKIESGPSIAFICLPQKLHFVVAKKFNCHELTTINRFKISFRQDFSTSLIYDATLHCPVEQMDRINAAVHIAWLCSFWNRERVPKGYEPCCCCDLVGVVVIRFSNP